MTGLASPHPDLTSNPNRGPDPNTNPASQWGHMPSPKHRVSVCVTEDLGIALTALRAYTMALPLRSLNRNPNSNYNPTPACIMFLPLAVLFLNLRFGWWIGIRRPGAVTRV